MRVVGWIALAVVALSELFRSSFELAGNTLLRLIGLGPKPKGVETLQEECGSRLPQYVYQVFKRAVQYHRRRDYSLACREYRKLRSIPLSDGTYIDLLEFSQVFAYNWRLLAAEMRR